MSRVATPTRAVTTTTATEEPRTFMADPASAIGARIEPQLPVGQRRLRPQERVVDPEQLPGLQVEALDLRSLVAVEDRVVAAIGEHEPESLFRALGQAPAFRCLREPEGHRQRIVQDEALLEAQVAQLRLALLVFVEDLHRPPQEDVEPAVDQHLE